MQDLTPIVNAVVAEVLGIEESEIDPSASLIDEYGAESIDFLDLTFKLNRQLGVKLFRGEFLKLAQEVLGDGTALLDDGRLTPAAVALIEARLPESAGNPALVPGAPRGVFLRLFSARTFVRQLDELMESGSTDGEARLRSWLEQYEMAHVPSAT